MADHPEQGVPHVAECAACGKEIGTFKAEGHELCDGCESDRLAELADEFDDEISETNKALIENGERFIDRMADHDGQPTEQEEWRDFDPDC